MITSYMEFGYIYSLLSYISSVTRCLMIIKTINKVYMKFRNLAYCCLLSSLLFACGKSDPYDTSKMDLKPTPAKISSERHTGAFAEGISLNMTSELKPLDPSPIKTVRLDTTHKIIEIAPGVRFGAWTFGDSVPGPTIRARVGDKIRFSMTNRMNCCQFRSTT
jgi:FtsP/CotA-like multicopper oxidase with cupredoxin domain